MKPRSSQFLPRTLMVCMAPLLACTSARAHVVSTNESNGTGVWTLPSGTNLLTGRTPSPATAAVHESSDSSWGTVIDGSIGNTGGSAATSCTPSNGDSVTFPLDLTGFPAGRNITSFDSYCTWGNSGRDNQDYTLQYSTVANPTTFINIHTAQVPTSGDRSTHTRLTNTAGFLATGVHSIRIVFNGQENGYVGYREFVLQDASSVVCVSNEKNNDNVWNLPQGPNLLMAPSDTPATHESSSGTWATTIDGSVGDYTTTASSVTPNNGNTVTFPLDLTGHPAGRDLTSFDSYAAWGSDGRDDQHYTLSYSTPAAPTTFIPITDVAAHSEFVNGPRRATHSRITSNTGILATGVHSIRLTFNGQENSYEGYREFIARDTPYPTTIVNESNNTGSWTLPTGTNLLNNALAKNPGAPANSNHGNGDITGSNWGILTDGSTGSAGVQTTSVAPLNATSVEFPLDTTSNTNGYNLTSFDSYGAWGDSGRDDQNFTIQYSKVSDPTTFITLETVANHTINPTLATHTRITPTSAYLATNVAVVKFIFNNQENGYVGYREFIALGAAAPLVNDITWTGAGSADWQNLADTNWKDTLSNAASTFDYRALVHFDSTGTNAAINLPTALTTGGIQFENDASHPYSFSGEPLTVTNSVTLSGAGTATFNNSLQATGVTISGTGTLNLSGSNSFMTGTTAVNNGTLNLNTDDALGTAALAQTAGTVNFTSASPSLNGLSGSGGSIFLGSGTGTTDLYLTAAASTSYAGSISDTPGSVGSLIKQGAGTLTLSGANNYTGTTTVQEGSLKLGKRLSLYNGNTASWTAANIIVQFPSSLSLRVGGSGEFTSSDVSALDAGGFEAGSVLSLDTTSGNYEITDNISGAEKLVKEGLNTLKLSGTNTFSSGITVTQGALEGANPAGVSIPSDLNVGNVTFDAWANMSQNDQFGPSSVIRFNTGAGAVNGKVNLRGTSQTVAGLVSGSGNRIAIVQNDETSAPGYTSNPGSATLTLNTPADTTYSFYGILRNQDGGAMSLVKNGPGTQEIVNAAIQGNSYNGSTSINEGTFRFNFAGGNTGFGSNISVAPGATLEFRANGGNYAFARTIAGGGNIVVDGSNAVIFSNAANSFTNGITVGVGVNNGFLALDGGGGASGAGTGLGQTCVGGAMDPSNIISVNNGATLSLDNIAALGNSTVLPAFAPSIHINEGSKLFGGTNTVAFVSNITLDGGKIQISDGANHGGFGTDLTFVGTVEVGGTSTIASEIYTTGTGANANASLGSVGLPGTTFHVTEVTGDSNNDLLVSTILRDIVNLPSPLVKSGPGTMEVTSICTYTGATTVNGGELRIDNAYFSDTADVSIATGATLNLLHGDVDVVGKLLLAGSEASAGIYGSMSNSTPGIIHTSFITGTGMLQVVPADPYLAWSAQITAGDSTRSGDPDGDGFTNLDEFLFGTDPTAANGSLSTVESTPGGLIIRWNQREAPTSSVYVLQESTDLNTWTTSSAVITDNATQDVSGYVRKEATITVDVAKKFARVTATE